MEARFKPGDRVRVRIDYPAHHFRTPGYIQGHTGWVEAVHGAFGNPETLAHGGDGLPLQPLYSVRFDHAHLWGRDAAGSPDRLFIDIYEHWLEPSE
jgi:nitrile hydratase